MYFTFIFICIVMFMLIFKPIFMLVSIFVFFSIFIYTHMIHMFMFYIFTYKCIFVCIVL